MSNKQDLKGKVFKGGVYLALRQFFAIGLSLVSALVIARILGPEKYGIVAVVVGVFYYLSWATSLGLNIYLVSQPKLPEDAQEQILAFYNTVGALLCFLAWVITPAIGVWTGQPVVGELLRFLVPALWLHMLGVASIGMLERELRFAEVGLIETLAQTANYLVAVPLVLIYQSYWGPILGYLVQFLLFAVLANYYYPIRLRLRWRWGFLKGALRYGLVFSGASWVLTLRNLVVPLLVSRLAGMEAAGIISISIRLTEQLALLRLVIRRLSISVLAKVSDNLESTRAAISQGITYQAILVGPLLAVFSCCSAWLIPLLFGPKWIPSVQIFPLIAAAALVSTIFDLHASALHAVGKNYDVFKFNLLNIALLWLASLIALPMLGVWGYGVAEILALPSYFLMHYLLSKFCGSPNYWDAFWVMIATLPPLLLGPWLPITVSLPILILSYGSLIVFRPNIRTILAKLYGNLRPENRPLVSEADPAAASNSMDQTFITKSIDAAPPSGEQPFDMTDACSDDAYSNTVPYVPNLLTQPNMLHSLQKRKQQRLTQILNQWEHIERQAMEEQWSYAQFLLVLGELEVERRWNRRVQRSLAEANLPNGKTLSNFDWSTLPQLDAVSIQQLAKDDAWLMRAENLILCGPSGAGKTHLAAGIARQMVELGQRVKFFPTFALIQQLQLAKQQLQLPVLLNQLDRFDLLLIDDIAYVRKSEEETAVLFELIAHRYERKSLLITTNQPLSQWDKIFAGPTMLAATIERLTHHALMIDLPDRSYRQKIAQNRQKMIEGLKN